MQEQHNDDQDHHNGYRDIPRVGWIVLKKLPINVFLYSHKIIPERRPISLALFPLKSKLIILCIVLSNSVADLLVTLLKQSMLIYML